jgi:nicotinate-nucleotide adenylyltransferase
MLCLATQAEPKMRVTKMELEMPESPYSVETLRRINAERPEDEIFFVMGADSWRDITTWREWETVLSLSSHIVVTRPGADIDFSHVTDDIRGHIIDLRHLPKGEKQSKDGLDKHGAIYITDVVNMDVSATKIRHKVREADGSWLADVPVAVANYIEKYQIYS